MITIAYPLSRIDHNQQTAAAAELLAQLVQAQPRVGQLHCQAQADHVSSLYWKKRCIMFILCAILHGWTS